MGLNAIMKRRLPGSIILVTVICGSAFAQPLAGAVGPAEANGEAARLAVPDLHISEFVFEPANEKAVRVQIVNGGGAASSLCMVRLTVTKINGIEVGRVTEVKLPPLAPGKNKWIVINAKSILPNNVSLEATTFKLSADATSIVTESNEANNEVWHNF